MMARKGAGEGEQPTREHPVAEGSIEEESPAGRPQWKGRKRRSRSPSGGRSENSCDSARSDYSCRYLNADSYGKNVSLCRKCLFTYFKFNSVTNVIYMRHGARTPKKKIQNIWPFKEGKGDLTFLGFQQSIKIGKYLRKYYYSMRKLNSIYNDGGSRSGGEKSSGSLESDEETNLMGGSTPWDELLPGGKMKKRNFKENLGSRRRLRETIKLLVGKRPPAGHPCRVLHKRVRNKMGWTPFCRERKRKKGEKKEEKKKEKKEEKKNDRVTHADHFMCKEGQREAALRWTRPLHAGTPNGGHNKDATNTSGRGKDRLPPTCQASYPQTQQERMLHIEKQKRKFDRVVKIIKHYLCVKTTSSERCKLTAYAIMCGILGITEKMFFFFFLLSFDNDQYDLLDADFMGGRGMASDHFRSVSGKREDRLPPLSSPRRYLPNSNSILERRKSSLPARVNFISHQGDSVDTHVKVGPSSGDHPVGHPQGGGSYHHVSFAPVYPNPVCSFMEKDCEGRLHTGEQKQQEQQQQPRQRLREAAESCMTRSGGSGIPEWVSSVVEEQPEEEPYRKRPNGGGEPPKRRSDARSRTSDTNWKVESAQSYSDSVNPSWGVLNRSLGKGAPRSGAARKGGDKFRPSSSLLHNVRLFFEFVLSGRHNSTLFYNRIVKTKGRNERKLGKPLVNFIFESYMQYVLGDFAGYVSRSGERHAERDAEGRSGHPHVSDYRGNYPSDYRGNYPSGYRGNHRKDLLSYLRNIYILCSVVNVAESNSLMLKTLKSNNHYVKRLKNLIFCNSNVYKLLNDHYKDEVSIVYQITKWNTRNYLNRSELLLSEPWANITPSDVVAEDERDIKNRIVHILKKHNSAVYKIKKKLHKSIILKDLKKLSCYSVSGSSRGVPSCETRKFLQEKIKNMKNHLFFNCKRRNIKVIKQFISSYDSYVYHNVRLVLDMRKAYRNVEVECSSSSEGVLAVGSSERGREHSSGGPSGREDRPKKEVSFREGGDPPKWHQAAQRGGAQGGDAPTGAEKWTHLERPSGLDGCCAGDCSNGGAHGEGEKTAKGPLGQREAALANQLASPLTNPPDDPPDDALASQLASQLANQLASQLANPPATPLANPRGTRRAEEGAEKKEKNKAKSFYKKIYECYKHMCTLEYSNKYLSWLCSGMSLMDVVINFMISVRVYEDFNRELATGCGGGKKFIPKIIVYLTHQSSILSFQSCVGVKRSSMKIPPFGGFLSLELVHIRKKGGHRHGQAASKGRSELSAKPLSEANKEDHTALQMDGKAKGDRAPLCGDPPLDQLPREAAQDDPPLSTAPPRRQPPRVTGEARSADRHNVQAFIRDNDTASIFCCKEDCVWKVRRGNGRSSHHADGQSANRHHADGQSANRHHADGQSANRHHADGQSANRHHADGRPANRRHPDGRPANRRHPESGAREGKYERYLPKCAKKIHDFKNLFNLLCYRDGKGGGKGGGNVGRNGSGNVGRNGSGNVGGSASRHPGSHPGSNVDSLIQLYNVCLSDSCSYVGNAELNGGQGGPRRRRRSFYGYFVKFTFNHYFPLKLKRKKSIKKCRRGGRRNGGETEEGEDTGRLKGEAVEQPNGEVSSLEGRAPKGKVPPTVVGRKDKRLDTNGETSRLASPKGRKKTFQRGKPHMQNTYAAQTSDQSDDCRKGKHLRRDKIMKRLNMNSFSFDCKHDRYMHYVYNSSDLKYGRIYSRLNRESDSKFSTKKSVDINNRLIERSRVKSNGGGSSFSSDESTHDELEFRNGKFKSLGRGEGGAAGGAPKDEVENELNSVSGVNGQTNYPAGEAGREHLHHLKANEVDGGQPNCTPMGYSFKLSKRAMSSRLLKNCMTEETEKRKRKKMQKMQQMQKSKPGGGRKKDESDKRNYQNENIICLDCLVSYLRQMLRVYGHPEML
ncbi:conserved Plasmodium protein, unknown function [Plasmodium vivax]|uniref:Uncharacterized protein n=1 Tax=Plasmodium vivax TaxID=5855 RepID=A0A1G4H888_PLAVI|nr:conserved Plasmodium protein, unknown function [Plasmodium vivax]